MPIAPLDSYHWADQRWSPVELSTADAFIQLLYLKTPLLSSYLDGDAVPSHHPMGPKARERKSAAADPTKDCVARAPQTGEEARESCNIKADDGDWGTCYVPIEVCGFQRPPFLFLFLFPFPSPAGSHVRSLELKPLRPWRLALTTPYPNLSCSVRQRFRASASSCQGPSESQEPAQRQGSRRFRSLEVAVCRMRRVLSGY